MAAIESVVELSQRRRRLLWGVVAVSVAAAAGGAGWFWLAGGVGRPLGLGARGSAGHPALEALGQYGEVPEFALVERSGKRVTRADLLGKVWVANFIYTQCTETCPLQSAELFRLQGEFAREPDLRLVSVTVDPERDTPSALSAYAQRYGADPARWLFLTGDRRAIYRLAKDGFRLGVVDPEHPNGSQALRRLLWPRSAWATHGSKGLIMHSARLVLVDRQAHIRAYHLPNDAESLDRLRRNLRVLLNGSD